MKARIWYRLPDADSLPLAEPDRELQIGDGNVPVGGNGTQYVTIGTAEADDLSAIYEAFARRNWNASGAATGWLNHLGLNRSQMRTGDVIETDAGRWFQVAKGTFREVRR